MYARGMVRVALSFAFLLALVPACSSTPQCVIDTDCPLGQYCTNPHGGSGGTCMAIGSGGADSGPTTDTGPMLDTGPHGDTGPTPDTGPPSDTGPMPDTGAHDAGSTDANADTRG